MCGTSPLLINELQKLLADVYRRDESGLFRDCLSNDILTLKGESCRGSKGSNERICVLFCLVKGQMRGSMFCFDEH